MKCSSVLAFAVAVVCSTDGHRQSVGDDQKQAPNTERGLVISLDGSSFSVDELTRSDEVPAMAFKCLPVRLANKTKSRITIQSVVVRDRQFRCDSQIAPDHSRVLHLLNESNTLPYPTWRINYKEEGEVGDEGHWVGLRLYTPSKANVAIKVVNHQLRAEDLAFLMEENSPSSVHIQWKTQKGDFKITQITSDNDKLTFSHSVESNGSDRDDIRRVVTTITASTADNQSLSRGSRITIHSNDPEIGSVVMWAFRRRDRPWWGMPIEKKDDVDNPPLIFDAEQKPIVAER